MLTAYYDLSTSPPTYDIVAFLSYVEAERQRRKEDKVHIIFLPGPQDGFRRDRFWPFTVEGRNLMLNRVAIPMAEMLPGAYVTKAAYRPDKPEPSSIGWGHSPYGLAVHVKTLRAGIRPLVADQSEWPGERPLVTITLREAEHWPERNSNLGEWLKAYHAIKAMGFDVVVIRDTVKNEETLAGIATNYRASWQLNHRAMMYRAAVANLGLNNGPLWFAMALDAPVLMFKPTVEGLNRSCSREYFRQCGIEPGGQYPNTPSYHRLAWEEDDAIAIIRAFKEFVRENGISPSKRQPDTEPFGSRPYEAMDELQGRQAV
jgi:hypothetical protein